MRKQLLLALALPLCFELHAQEYVPLQVTSGYSTDVIANGTGPALLSTTSAFDNANFALISADFQAIPTDPIFPNALPLGGLVNSVASPGLTFQLASYASENALRLQEETDFGSFAISNGTPATSLYVLAATGSGTATLGGMIHFSDNTAQEIAPGLVPDWFFSDALPIAIAEFGRVNLETDVVETPLGDPRLYQFQIDILPENQTKTITAIDFTKLSPQEGVINIFAVSARTLGTCPSPTQVSASDVTNNTATISWNEPVIVPNDGFAYYIGTDGTPPPISTVPNGYTTTGITSVALAGLTVGQYYCVWIRSICSGTEMGPLSDPVCFTTGQIDVTHPDDIPTLFADTVDINATTTCPGVMSVTVPDGYHITSVATSYDMQTALNGWMSEQNSILVCNTTGQMESAITTGVGSSTGTFEYQRSGLDIADGATGTVEFELRAWRTYGSSDCNTDYNRVVGGTWTVTVTVSDVLDTKKFAKNGFDVYPNPVQDFVNISGNDTILSIGLYNLLGQQVLHRAHLNAKQTQLPTAGLPSGQYVLKITSDNGVQSKSILKK